MATINLRDFYPWYAHDEFVDVPDEVAEELFAARRSERSQERRARYNKVQTLDADNGAEAYVIQTPLTPEAALAVMERHCALCRALNSLPDIQGRRIDAHYLCGMSQKAIAEAEGVDKGSVSRSITRGLQAMRKFLKNF